MRRRGRSSQASRFARTSRRLHTLHTKHLIHCDEGHVRRIKNSKFRRGSSASGSISLDRHGVIQHFRASTLPVPPYARDLTITRVVRIGLLPRQTVLELDTEPIARLTDATYIRHGWMFVPDGAIAPSRK